MAVKQYSWNDTTVVLFGRIVEGIKGVKWSRKVTKERQYGRGSKAQAILSGLEEISGSITLQQSELEAINLAIKAVDPLLDITKVAFDVVVNYENNAGVASTDRLVGVQVEEYEKALASGDTHMEIELPFLALEAYEGV